MTPLDHALTYAAIGLHVFPAHVNGRGAKAPMVKGWQEIASTDAAQLADWWGQWPGALIGMAHRLTGTLAIDIDTHHEGANGWHTLAMHRIIGRDDPQTWAFRSASGGAQRILLRPADLCDLSGNFPGSLGLGLDAIYGYSMLPSGDATPGREWVNHPADVAPAGAPEWVTGPARRRMAEAAALAMLAQTPARPMPPPNSPADGRSLRYVCVAMDGETAGLAATPQGQRHDAIHKAACNVGRALARAGRLDLAGWAADTLTAAGGWTSKPVHRATIADGLAWGMTHGGDA